MMKYLLVFSLSLVLRGNADNLPAYCDGESSFIPYPKSCTNSEGQEVAQDFIGYGSYTNVQPSGNYAIVSTDNNALILDLREWTALLKQKKVPRNPNLKIPCIVTPLSNEPYPVGPDWDLVSSSPLNGAMEYYTFEDLLKFKEKAKPILVDPKHREQYQSHSIIKKDKEVLEFQTMLYTKLMLRTYKLFYKEGKLTVDPTKSFGPVISLSPNAQVTEPILSRYGHYVGGLFRKTPSTKDDDARTQIFAIENNSLRKVIELPYPTSKVNIADTNTSELPSFAYVAIVPLAIPGKSEAVMKRVAELFDPQSKRFKVISFPWLESEASYPNILSDHLVIYTAKRKEGYGLVAVNPAQYPPAQAQHNSMDINSYSECFKYFNLKGERTKSPDSQKKK